MKEKYMLYGNDCRCFLKQQAQAMMHPLLKLMNSCCEAIQVTAPSIWQMYTFCPHVHFLLELTC